MCFWEKVSMMSYSFTNLIHLPPDFHLFYACVLFFLFFVNVMFGFDFWFPCFLKYVNPFLYLLALAW